MALVIERSDEPTLRRYLARVIRPLEEHPARTVIPQDYVREVDELGLLAHFPDGRHLVVRLVFDAVLAPFAEPASSLDDLHDALAEVELELMRVAPALRRLDEVLHGVHEDPLLRHRWTNIWQHFECTLALYCDDLDLTPPAWVLGMLCTATRGFVSALGECAGGPDRVLAAQHFADARAAAKHVLLPN